MVNVTSFFSLRNLVLDYVPKMKVRRLISDELVYYMHTSKCIYIYIYKVGSHLGGY